MTRADLLLDVAIGLLKIGVIGGGLTLAVVFIYAGWKIIKTAEKP